MTLNEKHILHVEAVNNSKTVEEHAANGLYLTAWRNGVRDAGGNIDSCLEKTVDREEYHGVWLDWEATK
jgi:hypothetical protein